MFPIPRLGDVFEDVRTNGRSMRVSCHADRGAVVVSLWHDTVCHGSFRLAVGDLDRFIATLTEMNRAALGSTPTVEQAEGSSPTPPDPAPATGASKAPLPGAPQIEHTGDVTGTANFGRLPGVPMPRVA